MFTVKVFKLELNHHECLPSFQKPFLFGVLFYCIAFIVTVTCCNYPRSRSNEELDKHIISTKLCLLLRNYRNSSEPILRKLTCNFIDDFDPETASISRRILDMNFNEKALLSAQFIR